MLQADPPSRAPTAPRLHHLPGRGSATLVIPAPDAAGLAWGRRLAARLRWPALLVAGDLPPEAIGALLPDIAAMAGADAILCGAGAGAAAALRLGAGLSARAAIALEPRHGAAASEILPPGAAPAAAILGFDPAAEGAAGLAAALAGSGVLAVPLPQAGGALAEILLESGALAEALAAAAAGDAARAAMALRVLRLASPRLRVTLAGRLAARGRARLAEAIGALAAVPAPVRPPPEARARILRRLGRHREEVMPLLEWAKREPEAAAPRRALAACWLALDLPLRFVPAMEAALAAGPVPARLQAALVHALRRLNRPEAAVQAARRAVVAAPGRAEPLLLLGETLLWAGQREAAAQAYARALGRDRSLAAARIGQAVASEEAAGPAFDALLDRLADAPEGDWHALLDLLQMLRRPALAAATRAVAAQPAAVALRRRLAGMLLAAGDLPAAEAAHRALSGMAPAEPTGWIGLVEALSRQKRHAEAAEVAARAVALHPAHAAIAARQAAALLAGADPVGAERAARRAVAIDAADEAAQLLLADALWRQHRTRDAVRAVEAALAARPGSVALGARLGHLLLSQGTLAPAIEAFQRIASQPQAPPHVWLGLGEALWQDKRIPEAIEATRKGLAAYPRVAELRVRLGQLLLAGGDADAARAALAEAVADNAASEVVHLAMAEALWRQGRRAEAVAAAREAASLAPDQPAVAARLGHFLLETDEVAEAAAIFERVTREAPDLVAGWVGMSDAERLRKRVRPALEAYRRAEALGMDRATRRMLRFRLFGELEE
jgi:tetratricopeptide (TPR) repeat protein